jgi:hypothetical protein
MSSFSLLIKDLENNFKTDLSPTGLDFNLLNIEIKLYNTQKKKIDVTNNRHSRGF